MSGDVRKVVEKALPNEFGNSRFLIAPPLPRLIRDLEYRRTKFQPYWDSFDKSCIINEVIVNTTFPLYFCYLHTLAGLRTKFQLNWSSFDKSCIINEMIVNSTCPIVFLLSIYPRQCLYQISARSDKF